MFLVWEWVWLFILLPALIFPSGWRGLTLIALPILWILRAAAQKEFYPRTPLNLALLVMAVSLLVSLYAVFDIELSFPKITGLLLGIALYFSAVSHMKAHRNGIWHITAVTLLAGFGMILIGAASLRWGGPLAPINSIRNLLPFSLVDLPGTDNGVNANQLAGIIVWIAPLNLALLAGLWRPISWIQRALWMPFLLVICGFSLLALGASQSRGGLASFAISLLLMLALAGKWGRWLAGTAVIVGIILLIAISVNGINFPVGLNVNPADLTDFGLSGRLEIWSRAIYALQDFPFTGVSMNGFRRVVPILYPLFLVSPEKDIAHAHNHLLQAGLDLGIPGLVAYLALWLLAAWLVWDAWRRATKKSHRVLAIGLAGALAGGWFFGVVDAIALGARPGFLWWLLLGLVVGLHLHVNQPSQI